MSTPLKEALEEGDEVVCISCEITPEEPVDFAKLDELGWRMTEFGCECPECAVKSKATEELRKQEDAHNMSIDGIIALANVALDPLSRKG